MDVEEQPQISVPDFRSFSTSEDLHSETVSHTHSETASSGYASMHGIEQLGAAEGLQNGMKKTTQSLFTQYLGMHSQLADYTTYLSHANIQKGRASVLNVTQEC